MSKGITRRQLLKGTVATVGLASLGYVANRFLGDYELDTRQFYGHKWFETAKDDLKKIKNLNGIIDTTPNSEQAKKARSKLDDYYIDPVLQEWENLQEAGLVENDIRLGDYQLRVLKHQGPTHIAEAGITSGVVVEIELYKGENKVDLNFLPYKESRKLNLSGRDWSIKKILEKYQR